MQTVSPLLKPMMFISTSDYILDVFGLFLIDRGNTDANVFNESIENKNSELLEW